MASPKRNRVDKASSSATTTKEVTSSPSSQFSPQVVLGILAIVVYLPTLKHGFVLDDGLVTTLNNYVKQGFAGLWDIFTHSYRAGATITTDSDYMYRPFSVLLFAIEWAFFPNQAWIHHLFNIVYYSLCILVMYKVLILLLGESKSKIIFAICILFTLHPIHTEVVCNIKSRDEILSFLFGMLSLFYYFKSLQNRNRYVWISCIFFFLAMLSKEGSIAWLFIYPLITHFFSNQKFFKNWIYLAITCCVWFLWRHFIMGDIDYIPDVHDNQLVSLNIFDRWPTAFLILLKYLKLLFWPNPLSWDYSFQAIKNVSWNSGIAILSMIIHLILFLYGCLKFQSKSILAFCFLAYLISISLYSNLFILIGTVMGERLIFLASTWFIFGLAYGLTIITSYQSENKIVEQKKHLVRFFSMIGILGFVFCWLTIQRSKDWKSSYDLFLHDVSVTPNSFRTNQAIADESLQLYMKNFNKPTDSVKYLTQAQKYYEASENILPCFSNQVGLGNTSLFQRNYDKAIDRFKKAQNLIDNTVIKERIFTAFYQYGRYEAQVNNNLTKAKDLLMNAYLLDSSKSEIVTDLGMVLGLNKEFNHALYYFEKSYKMDPNNETIVNNLIRTYILLGYQDKANELMTKLKK